jgi:hypothetical protein
MPVERQSNLPSPGLERRSTISTALDSAKPEILTFSSPPLVCTDRVKLTGKGGGRYRALSQHFCQRDARASYPAFDCANFATHFYGCFVV